MKNAKIIAVILLVAIMSLSMVSCDIINSFLNPTPSIPDSGEQGGPSNGEGAGEGEGEGEGETEAPTKALVTVEKDANVVSVVVYDYDVKATEHAPSTDNLISVGNMVGIQVTVAEGYEIASILINGEEAKLLNEDLGIYGKKNRGTDPITVQITTQLYVEDLENAKVSVSIDKHVTGYVINQYDKTAQALTDVTDAKKVAVGSLLAFDVICESGYVVDTVTINDEVVNARELADGMYFVKNVRDNTAIKIVVTTKPAE